MKTHLKLYIRLQPLMVFLIGWHLMMVHVNGVVDYHLMAISWSFGNVFVIVVCDSCLMVPVCAQFVARSYTKPMVNQPCSHVDTPAAVTVMVFISWLMKPDYTNCWSHAHCGLETPRGLATVYILFVLFNIAFHIK